MPEASERRRTVRCAVYTRKSTEEGLEQEFNSLDAQREAAESSIKSQRHLGWTVLPQHYDDGGFTGGNIERPALKRLLEDIESQRVDCVMVYKVDRLSRSLLDFARLMDRFDQRSVSFVSVTQQFNTTTSLGRLTLNILLSFAQFEREIIGERTRDKMSAARRKGKWIGGFPVLGYDVPPGGGRLIVNDAEAVRVREIFKLYAKHRSLAVVVSELQRRQWTTKSWTTQHGAPRVGTVFNKPKLLRLLTNATYVGRIEHKGTMYPGEQAAILEPELWDEINADLRGERRGRNHVKRTKQNGLLNGLLFCRNCNQPMVPTYTAKGDRRYRYYICQVARKKGWSACPTKSIAARLIEESVVMQLRAALSVSVPSLRRGLASVRRRRSWQPRPGVRPKGRVRRRERSGVVGTQSQMKIEYSLSVHRRRGPKTGIIPSPVAERDRPPRVTCLLALAHRFESLVQSGKVRDYTHLARAGHVSRARMSQILKLLTLAPSIQEYILWLPPRSAGKEGITERHLREIVDEPRWDHQRTLFQKLVRHVGCLHHTVSSPSSREAELTCIHGYIE